jgi:hypothetical protein
MSYTEKDEETGQMAQIEITHRFSGAALFTCKLPDAIAQESVNRAGWAITLAGEMGKRLEQQYGPHHAGRMIYIASTGRSPHFFASDAAAMEDIRERAAEQTQGAAS